MLRYIFSVCLVWLLVGCQSPSLPNSSQTKLYHLLLSLPQSNKQEAYRLSKEVISYANYLKEKFHPVVEPHFNNFLVNIGLQKQGLCYEWSDALYMHFSKRHYKYYTFHLIVANKGEYWSEHNAFAITTKGTNPLDGIIIDLWRDVDGIYISKISDDTQYQWIHRKEREFR